MTDLEKQYFLQFSGLNKEFSNALEAAMKEPTVEKGYYLHRVHQHAMFAWLQFVEAVAQSEAASEPQPEEPPKSYTVN